MRLTKIYTKIGDRGTTLLANGEEVLKCAKKIASYGTVDELNSYVGLLILHLPNDKDLMEQLTTIQNELFDVGGELSTPIDVLNLERQKVVGKSEIEGLEKSIDQMNESLPPLANFVLPGGNLANSYAHICRTVCRRAERDVVALMQEEKTRAEVQIYLNRLSDWFFVLARTISLRQQCPEVLWSQKR